jgi:adenosine deaminase
VVASSKASYLEIRTTPKGADKAARQPYIDTFVSGLQQANTRFAGRKMAYGLLSLDRSSCTPEAAHEIIDAVIAEKERSGLLVGIDLSGNYLAPRKLTGRSLALTLKYALSKNIGLALHVGEIDSPEERSEVDLILETLADWQKQQPSDKNPFHGKVRLGHGIFLTPKQIELIREMRLPMEICPACHEKLNWWKTNQPHPITKLYTSWQDPVVPGTDDELFFGEDARTANQRVLDFFAYPKDRKTGDAHAHHARFRFSSATPLPQAIPSIPKAASTSYWRYGLGAAVALFGLGLFAARFFQERTAADKPEMTPRP